MKNEIIGTAVLWVAALGVVAYLFKGDDKTAIAIILIGILGFVNVILVQTLIKGVKSE